MSRRVFFRRTGMIVFKGLKPAKILGKRLIVLFGICCLSNGYCDVFRLTVNGCPDAEIVEEKQIQSDIAFFNTALKRCTGTELPVVTQPSPGKKVIKFDIARQPLDREDAFTISFPSRNEMLISGSPNSARWAMNHLLESLGVRFVMSGAHGTHYPKLSSAEVPLVPVKKDAAFKLRRKMHAEDPQWERCLNGKRETGGELFETHNLFRIFPPGKNGAEKSCPSIEASGLSGRLIHMHTGSRVSVIRNPYPKQ